MTVGNDSEAVRAVIQGYVNSCTTGDVDALQGLFSDGAAMNGLLAGQCLQGGPQPFFDAVSNSPSPSETGVDYQSQISDIIVSGNIACATLRERNYLGLAFTNYFHLLRVDGNWMIVSKLFESSSP